MKLEFEYGQGLLGAEQMCIRDRPWGAYRLL